MKRSIHYNWTRYAFVELGFAPELAQLIASSNQMVDAATPENVNSKYATNSEPMPAITQSDIVSGVYKLVRGGWSPLYNAVSRWHFPSRHGLFCNPAERDWRDVQEAANELAGRASAVDGAADAVFLSVKVGALMHAAQDRGYAHLGFRGYPHKSNADTEVKGKWWRRLYQWCLPNKLAWGHSEYGDLPDTLNAVWKRNGFTVRNRDRFVQMGIDFWKEMTGETIIIRYDKHGKAEEWFTECPDGAIVSTIPNCVQVLLSAANDDDLADLCDVGLRTRGVEPYQFEMFKPESEEWRLFCHACR